MRSVAVQFWEDGWYLFVITVLSVFASFLPLIVNVGDIGTIKNEISRTAILDAMESKEWQFALVANIAVAFPVVLDFILDTAHNILIGSNNKVKLQLPRILLIFSLLGPNLLILFVSIPFQYVEFTVCIFTTRISFLVYGVLGHLWTEGGYIFRSNWFIAAHSFFAVGIITVTYDTINANPGTFLFWFSISIYAFAIIIVFFFVIKFSLVIRNQGFWSLDSSKLSCFLYLSLFCAIGVYFYISGIVYEGKYSTNFCVTYTCVEGFCTLLLSALQSRLTRHEVIMKEVKRSILLINISSFNLICTSFII